MQKITDLISPIIRSSQITGGEEMNKEHLKRLYSRFYRIPKLEGVLATECSAPLLLDVNPSWETSQVRLLVVGQETMGWGIDDGDYNWQGPTVSSYKEFFESGRGIEAMMYLYQKFNFAASQPENRRSPFWRAFQELSSPPEIEPLWSNLFRCSVRNGSVIRNCSKDEFRKSWRAREGCSGRNLRS